MNASRARKEGRQQFCPEDKPMDYFKRVGRNPSLYELQCFTQGWDEEADQYDKRQEKEPEPLLDEYDAGCIPDYPDQDYVRYILSCAFDFYESQVKENR